MSDYITIKEASNLSGRTRQYYYAAYRRGVEKGEDNGCFKSVAKKNGGSKLFYKKGCVEVLPEKREKISEQNPDHKKMLSDFMRLYGALYESIENEQITMGAMEHPQEKVLANMAGVDSIIVNLIIETILRNKTVIHGVTKTKISVREAVRDFMFRYVDHTQIILDAMSELVAEREG